MLDTVCWWSSCCFGRSLSLLISFSQEDETVEIVGEDLFGEFPADGFETGAPELSETVAVFEDEHEALDAAAPAAQLLHGGEVPLLIEELAPLGPADTDLFHTETFGGVNPFARGIAVVGANLAGHYAGGSDGFTHHRHQVCRIGRIAAFDKDGRNQATGTAGELGFVAHNGFAASFGDDGCGPVGHAQHPLAGFGERRPSSIRSMLWCSVFAASRASSASNPTKAPADSLRRGVSAALSSQASACS